MFLHGRLEQSQESANQHCRKYSLASPSWAERFRLLSAEAMVWRGWDADALAALSFRPSPQNLGGIEVKRMTLQGVAYTHLQQFAEAQDVFTHAQAICARINDVECVSLTRAKGGLAFERGLFSDARTLYLESLESAKQRNDSFLVSTILLNLSTTALQTDRYDEALSWSLASYRAAMKLGAEDLAEAAKGNLGWAYFRLGDPQRAANLFLEAEADAQRLGDTRDEIRWLTTNGYVNMGQGHADLSRRSYEKSLELAREIKSKEEITNALLSLALVAVASKDSAAANQYADQAFSMAQQSGSHPDVMDAVAVQVQAAALLGDTVRATQLLKKVESDPDSQTSMKWACEDAMARLYETNKQPAQAQAAYQSALSIFESARAELQHEDSQLPFLANATRIYDDYIHFLVTQGRTQEALLVADQSRARTLAQGLGQSEATKAFHPATISPQAVARKAGATLLFYWLGERQSYLWAVTPEKTTLFPLPPQGQIAPLLERYRKTLLGAEDPLQSNPAAGEALYAMLVGPAAKLIRPNTPAMILADGPLSLLNFETLIVPPSATQPAHYWIEDATLSAAPSLAMLAAAKPARAPDAAQGKLLLLGDAVSPGEEYPELPYARDEMQRVERHFAAGNEAVFARGKATPSEYLSSDPRRFAYIHFVSHGVASRTDPLDSAIILSRAGGSGPAGEQQDSFKLYAREVMQHPIDARLVTISACYGSGTRAYAGEGLVGLSWAFLRAGAHSAIGALWEVTDNSTPELMDTLYQGMFEGQPPAAALRRAKLAMLHSRGNTRKPFYWAPFQIYTRL
jgi:CHAT domain-containing protein